MRRISTLLFVLAAGGPAAAATCPTGDWDCIASTDIDIDLVYEPGDYVLDLTPNAQEWTQPELALTLGLDGDAPIANMPPEFWATMPSDVNFSQSWPPGAGWVSGPFTYVSDRSWDSDYPQWV